MDSCLSTLNSTSLFFTSRVRNSFRLQVLMDGSKIMVKFTKPYRNVYAVYIHCSASDRPEHDDVSVMRQWHLANGWSDVGYHYFIRKDGEIQAGRSVENTPAGQKGHNRGSIAICLHGLDESKFAANQFNSLRDLCAAINGNYSTALEYHGHCEVSSKSCPVFDYKTVLGLDSKHHMTTFQRNPEPILGDEYYDVGVLRIFDRGEHVKYLQQLLNRAGAYLVEDGIFGRATKNAVVRYQQLNNLVVDGLVGSQTWESLSHFGAAK